MRRDSIIAYCYFVGLFVGLNGNNCTAQTRNLANILPSNKVGKGQNYPLDITAMSKWHCHKSGQNIPVQEVDTTIFQSLAAFEKQIMAQNWMKMQSIFCAFRMVNESDQPLRLLLRLSRNTANHQGSIQQLLFRDEPNYTRLYEIQQQQYVQIARGGKHMNAQFATYRKDKSYLPFELKPNESKIFIVQFFDSLPLRIPNLYVSTEGLERQQNALIIQKMLPLYPYYTLVIGLLFFMSLTGFARYLFFSDQSFLFYGLYIGLNGLYFFIIMDCNPYTNGLIYNYAQWLARFLGVVLILSYAFYIRFAIDFLRLQILASKSVTFFWRAYYFSLALALVIFFMCSFIHHVHTRIIIGNGALVLMMVIGLVGIFKIWNIPTTLARIIIVGTVFFYTGSIIGFLESLQLIQVSSASLIIQSPLFPTTLGCMIEAITFFGGLGYRQKLLQDEKKMVEAQYLQQVEENLQLLKRAQEEKELIARDLHDEIGSTLSSISILSEAQKRKAVRSNDLQVFDVISERARQVMAKMSDIVWSVNPNNAEMDAVLVKMLEYASETLEAKEIEFSFEVDETLPSLHLTMGQRKDFYLFFKEAINNAAKYAQAKQVWGKIYCQANKIHLEILDDGRGFDNGKIKAGNGLQNMRVRAERLYGTIEIKSSVNHGTTIKLSFPIATQ